MLLVFCTILGLYLVYIYFPYYLFLPKHGLDETRLNEVKKIPQEVKETHPVATRSATFSIPILMYHYVEYVKDKKDTIRQSLDTTPDVLTAQIRTLKDNYYTFLTMSEVADIIDGKKVLPQKPVVLTFDDGYRDFYTDVFPILSKEKIKAVAYVVPGFFDQTNYLLTKQVLQLAKSPYVELGAHTMHHVYLKDVAPLFASREIKDSKYQLENLIHKPVVSFAYPYGAFDNSAIDLAKASHFRTAVTTISGLQVSKDNRFFLFRIRPGYKTGEALLTDLASPPFAQ